MTGRRLLLAASLGLAALGAAVGVSFAAFSSTTTNPGGAFSARPDFVPPNAGRSIVLRSGGTVPGYVKQAGAYYVYANVTDSGNPASGTATVKADASALTTGAAAAALSSGSWSVGGQTYNWRSAALTAKAALAEGATAYTLALADNAANSQTQSGFSVTVDNTAPTASDIQATNGGSANHIDAGDTITYTFSEPIDPDSVLSGWDGSATTVDVTITSSNPGTMTTNANLGSVNLDNKAFNGSNGTCTATMTMSGSTVTLTLGTIGGSRFLSSSTLQWTPSSSLADRAGNAAQTTTATESGPTDDDF